MMVLIPMITMTKEIKVMSKRKVRKLRHRTDQLPILTFNQLSQMGTIRAKLLSGEITSDQIPPWMLGEAPVPPKDFKPEEEVEQVHLDSLEENESHE